ncbi:MAG: hypothetical protein FWD57_00830 [Polyangiaceae bacterium]|nr:hypothetical protein [Polyangiaceae bacterium]
MIGLLVGAAAVSFSRQSTRFFAQEARIANAQMSVLAGFQRLQADVSRAAYMSTPDMRRDLIAQRLCAPDYHTWPTEMQELTSIGIISVAGQPDTIRISGNLASSETFDIFDIESGGSSSTIVLRRNRGPMTRAGFIEGYPGVDAAFQNVFRPGRLIRIADDRGQFEYQIIQASSFENVPTITTIGTIPIIGDTGPAGDPALNTCGIAGRGRGMTLNPVSVVEYSIASLETVSPYKETIYHPDYAVTGSDDGRTELIRTEKLFLENSVDIQELVAEFAVDLRVGVWTTDNTIGVGVRRGAMTYISPEDASVATAPVAESDPIEIVKGPTAIRMVDLRLVVRSREADRAEGIDSIANPLATDGYMFRAPIPGGRWARARTLSSSVALMNHRGDAW